MAKSLPVATLPYRKTLNLYVLTDSGKPATVRECSPGAFEVLVKVSTLTLRGEQDVARLRLKFLDYSQPEDKWYALTVLGELGAKLPLFTDEEQALESVKSSQKKRGKA